MSLTAPREDGEMSGRKCQELEERYFNKILENTKIC